MKKFTLRFPDETEKLYDAINKSAQDNHRSLNGEILRALEFYLQVSTLIAPETAKETVEIIRKEMQKANKQSLK